LRVKLDEQKKGKEKSFHETILFGMHYFYQVELYFNQTDRSRKGDHNSYLFYWR